ncbi:SDR family oxidoreductase [Mycobacterium sp. Marseille-P9652]|uniref:SDR family oxidoreductase n=1 Tax=Mycobacterium sp. Marseille-P9652 TaxID=2654950 RepID=UPI0012E9914E|nr:SDR family oxidoreductase [Mycobacterium sp. Marseille-P9652]
MKTAVLVTGAAGHVGAEVVHRLTGRGHDVVALVHDEVRIIANNGRPAHPAQVLRGDVRSPGFGLDRKLFSWLVDRVGLIVHCAALTEFGLSESRYTELNVDGTANALEVARSWDAGIIYVSTAYVCGEFDGTFREDELDIGQPFGNDYERSKFRAEQLVRAAPQRWAVVRPGIVSGEYRTGHSRVHKHIYPVLKLIAEGKMRTLPGNYAATLALSPIGHVADTVVSAVERFGDNVGHTFHAVGANEVSLRSMSDVLAEYPSLRMVDLVPPSTFSPDDLDDIERAYFHKVGSLYTTYLRRRPHFDSTNARERLGVVPPPIGAGYMRRVLDSCLQTGYLGSAEPTVADVLAELQLMRSGR